MWQTAHCQQLAGMPPAQHAAAAAAPAEQQPSSRSGAHQHQESVAHQVCCSSDGRACVQAHHCAAAARSVAPACTHAADACRHAGAAELPAAAAAVRAAGRTRGLQQAVRAPASVACGAAAAAAAVPLLMPPHQCAGPGAVWRLIVSTPGQFGQQPHSARGMKRWRRVSQTGAAGVFGGGS